MTFDDADPGELEHLRERDAMSEARMRIEIAVRKVRKEKPAYFEAILFELAQADQCLLRAVIMHNDSREKP
jgi:hypothetical protein